MSAKSNRVCLCLDRSTLADNWALLQSQKYFDPAQDVVELRLDFMLDYSGTNALEQSLNKLCKDFVTFPPPVTVPFILTLRKKIDGGLCPDSLPDSDYLTILKHCLAVFPAAYLDLDAGLWQRIVPRSRGEASAVFSGLLSLLSE
ncbi:MAG: type I 3-dehydroquinate dehydratase, partial [Spirochaetota bacterium]